MPRGALTGVYGCGGASVETGIRDDVTARNRYSQRRQLQQEDAEDTEEDKRKERLRLSFFSFSPAYLPSSASSCRCGVFPLSAPEPTPQPLPPSKLEQELCFRIQCFLS